MSVQEIRGPLGIWPFPFLNFLVKSILANRPILGTQVQTPLLRNKEDVTWTDWKGRERHIVIHREVE